MKKPEEDRKEDAGNGTNPSDEEQSQTTGNPQLFARLEKLRKGDKLVVERFEIREGKTSPPKRYNSGSIILAMENAGQLIEDEELREQIRTCGIGTSATRAEILKKLENNRYISLNKKTQILTPTLLGEMIFDVVRCSISALLSPAFTASWEKGLNYVVEGSVTSDEYMQKLSDYVARFTNQVKNTQNASQLLPMYQYAAQFYKNKGTGSSRKPRGRSRTSAKRTS